MEGSLGYKGKYNCTIKNLSLIQDFRYLYVYRKGNSMEVTSRAQLKRLPGKVMAIIHWQNNVIRVATHLLR